MKKPLILLVTTLFSLHGFAQGTEVKSSIDDPLLPVYIIAAVILVIIILLIVVAFALLRTINTITTQAAKEKAAKLGIPYVPAPNWWDRFTQTGKCFCPCGTGKKYRIRSQLRWY